jgi:two-component system sensor histidine kinase KdpD
VSSLSLSCLALGAVAACTWVSFQLGLGLATSGFLYLAIVVVTAIYCGFWPASSASLAAVACLNFFFVDPVLTFRVASVRDWIALWTFEFTALVVSRLSHLAARRASEAAIERRNSERLYQISRRVLLFDASRPPGQMLTQAIQEIFELDAVVLLDSAAATLHRSGIPPHAADEWTRSAYLRDRNEFDPATRSWYCALRIEARPVGALALCGGELSSLAANALASLCTAALERAFAVQRECHAEAIRQSEQLRAAVLDALGHEFKTPLTTIWTASSAMLEVGELSALQHELVTLIDDQSKKLNDLASRLLTTARLDGGDFHPALRPVLCSTVVQSVVESLNSREVLERIRIERPAEEQLVMADAKLLGAALTQLIDNAVKYSTPGSAVEVGFSSSRDNALVTVRSHGVTIAPSERERIFERFYRSRAGGDAPPGTGLGLSIVKRIAECHQGSVWVERDEATGTGTLFCFTLPLANDHLSCDEFATASALLE